MSIPTKKNLSLVLLAGMALSLLLGACTPAPTPMPTVNPAFIQTQTAQTVVADLTLNAPAPTQPPDPTDAPTQAQPPGPTPDPRIPVAVVPTPAPGEPSAVANFNTTIFSGPGESYAVYATLLGSNTARVIGQSEDGGWWVISVPVAPDGAGWVNAGWVTVSGTDGLPVYPTPPVPPTAEMVPPGPGDPQATALTNVNVRTGPSQLFPAYGIATTNTTGRVLGVSEDNQWWVVRIDPSLVGAGYGWVAAEYTFAQNVVDVPTIKTPPSPLVDLPPPPPAGVPSVMATDAVNIRSGPGTNYLVLVVAPAGASGEVTGVSADGQWWQVKISTQYSLTGLGWVSSSYTIARDTQNVPIVAGPPAPPVVGGTPPDISANQCTLVAQTPVDGTTFTIGTPFDATWVLTNTSSSKWDQSEFDVVFVGAAENVYLHTGQDLYDLTTTVEPGMSYNLTIPMLAPFSPGVYGELWQIASGSGGVVCQFYVYIEVQ